MDILFTKNTITFDKDLNDLDEFVLEFVNILNKAKIKYVIISGYVAILFGRSRSSEDVDVFIERIGEEQFFRLWSALEKEFMCINTSAAAEAYQEYLCTGIAIRFSKKSDPLPNMEVKFPKEPLDTWTLEHRKAVILNGHALSISPIELQIPFKLFLASPKDIEDAVYLNELFKDHLNSEVFAWVVERLNVASKVKRYL